MRMRRGVFCVYDEPSTDLCLHKNLYLEENNCFGIYLYLWHIDEKRKNSYDGVIQVPGRWGK